jgi:hypothetical protein
MYFCLEETLIVHLPVLEYRKTLSINIYLYGVSHYVTQAGLHLLSTDRLVPPQTAVVVFLFVCLFVFFILNYMLPFFLNVTFSPTIKFVHFVNQPGPKVTTFSDNLLSKILSLLMEVCLT